MEKEKAPLITTPFQQRIILLKYRTKCLKILTDYYKTKNISSADTLFCPPIFDDFMCWGQTPVDTEVRQQCANYYKGFDSSQYAYKLCTENGTWYTKPSNGELYTNFSQCMIRRLYSPGRSTDDDTENLRILYTTGYSISLFFLVIAVIIMIFCRRLQSKSNVLHIHLFCALILRSSIALLKDTLFVMNRIGMASDYVREPSGKLTFIDEGTHWECRLIICILNFSICACHMWIFVEGLYLYMLIHKPLYIGRKGVGLYITLGWTLPLLNIIPWIVVKALLENTHCWTIQENPLYFWILKGPGVAVVFINFFFFVDIIRMLCLRIRSRSCEQHNNQSYRKLTKFILVLIPLFGVTYIVFYAVQEHGGFTKSYLYAEMTYNSFQGFILALLFCFLNEDIHKELERVWYRRRSRMGDHLALTRSTLLSSWKKTSLHSTNSNSVVLTCRKTSREASPESVTGERLIDKSNDLLKYTLKHNAETKADFA